MNPWKDLHALPPIGLYAFRVAKGLLVPQAITHRGASLAVKVLRRSASAESILSVIPQTGDHIFHTQYAFQEREPSPHAPNMRPYPRSTRSSQANTATVWTYATPCSSLTIGDRNHSCESGLVVVIRLAVYWCSQEPTRERERKLTQRYR